MRPVKSERKPRSRADAPKRSARGVVTRSTVQPGSAGKRETLRQDPVSRSLRNMRGWLIFRRPMLVLGLGFIAFTAVAALFIGGTVGRTVRGIGAAFDAVVADAGFGISEIHIAGNARTPPEMITAALGFEPGQSIFNADIQAARARLMGLDWVADAEVQRRYPDSISVRLVEKLPFALWKSPAGLYVVERSGGVITNKNVEQFAHLPVLAGAGAPAPGAEIVDAVATHRAVFARTYAIQRQSERRWNLLLQGDVVVKLPETGWQKELDTLEHLIVDKGILEKDVTEIDLRSPTHYFFILKTGEEKKVDRGA